MKGKKRYIVIFVTIFLIGVIVNIPAAWVFNQFVANQAKASGISVSGISGTVWSGQAQQINVIPAKLGTVLPQYRRELASQRQPENLGTLMWDFNLAKLLVAKAELAIEFGRGSNLKFNGSGDVGTGLFGGIYANQVLASIPIESIMQYVTTPVPIDLSGQLALTLNEFEYAQPWCEQADGTLAWTGAAVNTPIGLLSPGSVIADLKCDNQKVAIEGGQDNQEVSTHFSVTLDEKSQYKVTSWFKPGVEFPEAMGNNLNFIGNPDGQGRYPFNLSGRL